MPSSSPVFNSKANGVTKTPNPQTPLPVFEIPAPFDAATVWALGRRDNWPKLKELLFPVASNFYVTDRSSQTWLDSVIRSRFDTAKDPDTGMCAVYEMVSYYGGDDAEMMERILACGVSPDVAKKHSWRPLHICGSYARAEAAKALLLCRPDLVSKNHHGRSPLGVARVEKYPEDDRYPERVEQRPKVAALIEGYLVQGFPKLAELACKREWFAVKNLVRRQVVGKTELTKEKYEGKTALQWAEFHDEIDMALELAYYIKVCLAKQAPGARLKRRLKNLRMWSKKVAPPSLADQNGDHVALRALAAMHADATTPPSKAFTNGVATTNGHVVRDELPSNGFLSTGHVRVHAVTSV